MTLLESHPALLAVLVFCARVTDVSLGTVRTILVFRGHRLFAALTGFFELLVWIVAAGAVFRNLDRWYLALAYAGGFAAGNVVGMWVESKLAIGLELVRAISFDRDVRVADLLRANGHAVTEVPGRSGGDPVEVLLVVERRRRVPRLLELIRAADPRAICTLSDVRPARAPERRPWRFTELPAWLRLTKRK